MYDPKSAAVTPCARCGGPRTFECQLMPHLISLLRSTEPESKDSDKVAGNSQKSTGKPEKEGGANALEARRGELEDLLRKGGTGRSMEWGTCMIFSCAADCAFEGVYDNKGERKEAKELWAEELVLVQWEE